MQLAADIGRWEFLTMASAVAFTYWVILTLELIIPNPWLLVNEGILPLNAEAARIVASFVHHVLGYGLLAVVLMWAARASSKRRMYFQIAIVHALVTEAAQLFLPFRTADFLDACFNLFGLWLGYRLGKQAFTVFQAA